MIKTNKNIPGNCWIPYMIIHEFDFKYSFHLSFKFECHLQVIVCLTVSHDFKSIIQLISQLTLPTLPFSALIINQLYIPSILVWHLVRDSHQSFGGGGPWGTSFGGVIPWGLGMCLIGWLIPWGLGMCLIGWLCFWGLLFYNANITGSPMEHHPVIHHQWSTVIC